MNRQTRTPRSTRRAALQIALVALVSASATKAFAIAGKGAKLEFAIDAPWRLEPTKDSKGITTYGTIPIQISIHDAVFSALDEQIQFPSWTSDRHVGRFVELVIAQVDVVPGFRSTVHPPQRFGLLDLDLIERTTGVWQFDINDPCLDAPRTEVCRVWKDPDCAAAAQWIEGTSEWHAVFHYAPLGTTTPGSTIKLQATVRLSREHAKLTAPPTGSFAREVTLHDVKEGLDLTEDPTKLVSLVNEVAVYLGDEPLPRFGNDWLYGDLHYHSQGTDNEGESAYNYRGVLEAMGAMGIDFVFATEHASDSPQLVDGDTSIGIPPVSEDWCGLRDMSPGRFTTLHGSLHGTQQNPDGANRTVMDRPDGRLPQTYLSHGAVPQVFLGGEVDVIPEIGIEELISPRPEDIVRENNIVMADGFAFEFGDGLRYFLTNLCGGAINPLPGSACYQHRVIEEFGDTYLLKDVQGVNDHFHARQHLIYLPGRQDNALAFVSSRTEKYGGGGRLLFRGYENHSGVVPEIEAKEGYFFLAHPLNSPAKGTLGPDCVPYSDHELREAMKSPAFLGLQLWNEDTRLYSEAMDAAPPMSRRGHVLGTTETITEPDGKDDLSWDDGLFALTTNDAGVWNPVYTESRDTQFEGRLYHGAYTWDRMLLWGLGSNFWFTRGCEPRKVLIAGGSDAHGDFNYRREGYFHGSDGIVDTAIAKPRNLVHAGAPLGKPVVVPGTSLRNVAPPSQEQIIEALRSGEFCVTDGPALRISIGDTPMGGVHYLAGSRITVTVEWKSSPEFGPLDEIHLYVGAGSSASCAGEDRNCPEIGIVYTPSNAGPRNSGDDQYPTPGPFSSGPPFTIYRTSERLRINAASVGHPLGYSGTTTVSFGNGNFPLANANIADRFFVRAVGRTSTQGCGERASLVSERCQPRFAFTNPIWVLPGSLAVPPPELFQRGDANGDGLFNISDALTILAYLFRGGVTPGCEKACDVDSNGSLGISDATRALGFLFLDLPAPAAPFPACGKDPTTSRNALTCRVAPACGTGGELVPAPACLPDLTISKLEKRGELQIGALQGFTQTVLVTVQNAGGKTSGPCRLSFSRGSGGADLAPLDPGASRNVAVDLRFTDSSLGGHVQLSSTIDGESDVEESREDNNRSATVTVDFPDHCDFDPIEDDDPGRYCWSDPPPEPARPDIVAVELKVTSKIVAQGASYTFDLQVTLKNTGTRPAGAFPVALRSPLLKGAAYATPWSIHGLATGATQSFTAAVTFPVAGNQGTALSLIAVADPGSRGAPGGSIVETNETNNATPPITVKFP